MSLPCFGGERERRPYRFRLTVFGRKEASPSSAGASSGAMRDHARSSRSADACARSRAARRDSSCSSNWARAESRQPSDAVEPVQDPQQFVVAELEGCGGEKQHPLEHVAQRALEGHCVLFSLLVCEQAGELVLILDVMRLVKNEQRQVLVERPQAIHPRTVEGMIELVPRRAEPCPEAAVPLDWHGG